MHRLPAKKVKAYDTLQTADPSVVESLCRASENLTDRGAASLDGCLQFLDIRFNHQTNQFPESDGGLPLEASTSLGSVRAEEIHLRRPEVPRIYFHPFAPIEIRARERRFHKFANRMRLTGADHVIVGLVLLEHKPHGPNKIGSVSPVSPRVKVAQI